MSRRQGRARRGSDGAVSGGAVSDAAREGDIEALQAQAAGLRQLLAQERSNRVEREAELRERWYAEWSAERDAEIALRDEEIAALRDRLAVAADPEVVRVLRAQITDLQTRLTAERALVATLSDHMVEVLARRDPATAGPGGAPNTGAPQEGPGQRPAGSATINIPTAAAPETTADHHEGAARAKPRPATLRLPLLRQVFSPDQPVDVEDARDTDGPTPTATTVGVPRGRTAP